MSVSVYRKGTKVEWAWGRGHVEGVIEEIFKESVTRTIKGKKVTRHGSKENPAYLIRHPKGIGVLKLHSEIKKSEDKHRFLKAYSEKSAGGRHVNPA